MVGSVGGAMIAFWFGRRLGARRLRRKLEQKAIDERGLLDAMIERFRRHGPAFLIVNRFVPGLRAIALVAAGMSGMRTRPVLIYAAISSALYNLALMALGAVLGANLDELRGFVSTYTTWSLVIVVAISLVITAVVLLRRRKRRREATVTVTSGAASSSPTSPEPGSHATRSPTDPPPPRPP
jgi:membrane protein DedA with SNARE-associated domain